MDKILTIFRHELAGKRRNAGLKWLFAMMQLLLLVALLTGWHQYSQTAAQQSTAQTLVEQQWRDQPSRHPHRVAHFGHFTFRPPGTLAFFDVGVNNFVGNSIFIEAHRQNSANFANDQDASVLLRFSGLSVANILLLFWPLLLISVGFNAVAGERQNGTLRQLLSVNISLGQLLLGKGLAYLLLSLLFIGPVFIATLAVSGFADITLTSDSLWRIGGLFVVYLGYCLVWLLLILLASCLISSIRNTLLVLVSLWFGLTILMPRVVADIADHRNPLMGRNDFELTVQQLTRQVGDSHNPDDPHFNQFKQRILSEYKVQKVEDLPVNYKGLLMKEGERISADIFAKQYRLQLQQLHQQQDFVSGFYWLNPYLFARDLSMALSATDAWHFFDYEWQTEAHRYARIQKLNAIHTEHIDHKNDGKQLADKALWQTFNHFDYQQPSPGWSLQPFMGFWWLPLLLLVGCVWLLLVFPGLKMVRRRLYALA